MKVHDKLELPMQLDRYPHTVQGQDERRRCNGLNADGESTSRGSLASEYEFMGTVVHMGTAHSGHHYSILREETSSDPSQSHQCY